MNDLFDVVLSPYCLMCREDDWQERKRDPGDPGKVQSAQCQDCGRRRSQRSWGGYYQSGSCKYVRKHVLVRDNDTDSALE